MPVNLINPSVKIADLNQPDDFAYNYQRKILAMKNLFFLILIMLMLASCATQRKTAQVRISNDAAESEDSLEYELIIIDPGFETWFISTARPVWFYSQSYLETWNRQYVSAWNQQYTGGRNSRVFETFIDYQPTIDYGLDLNYRLFYYFQYVEKKLKIPILPSGMGPRAI